MIRDPEFLQAAATVLAGVLIFLTIERKIEMADIFPGGTEQQRDQDFKDRVEEKRKQRIQYLRLRSLEGLSSISLVVLEIETEIPLSRYLLLHH
jgi:hypothetical protein